jgi:phosphomannomutase
VAQLHASTLAAAMGGLVEEAHFADVMPAFRVVADSVNASGATVLNKAASLFGLTLAQLAGTDSGVFPHVPEPTAENLSGEGGLCAAVPALRADVGLAQDPDADRLALVDEDGRYIGEEYTLVLAAMALLAGSLEEEDDDRQPVIVVNLSTSRMIDDVAERLGARVERTPVGEANVVTRMVELMEEGERVVLGGEGNGGVIWPAMTLIRDSVGAMGLVLGLMALTGKTISALVGEVNSLAPGGAGYAIVKRKVTIATKADAGPAVATVTRWAATQPGARADTQDGVRVDLPDWNGGGAAWVHVRASNTEPIMRLIAEAGSEEGAVSLLATVEAAIAGR